MGGSVDAQGPYSVSIRKASILVQAKAAAIFSRYAGLPAWLTLAVGGNHRGVRYGEDFKRARSLDGVKRCH